MGALSRHELRSNQVRYSLEHRNVEREVLPFCKENKISMIAYSPLGTGELIHGRKSKALSEVAIRCCRTKAQVALNWLYSKQVISIPKAARRDHVEENAHATDFLLSQEDIAKLEAA